MATTPRILDPACGSGIFLVEAFRRIVRYHTQKYGTLPNANQIRAILRDQLCGIEINAEAARVTAFSLYLALLHYQEPPDILNAPRLPNLVYQMAQPQDGQHYGIIHHTDTFALTDEERADLTQRLEDQPSFKGRIEIERLRDSPANLPLDLHSFEIIIGNPPWGAPAAGEKQAERWWSAYKWSIGDREQSQAFIARSLSLLKTGGEAGLLVSTGVFFKHDDTSHRFRQRWLAESTLKSVVSFTHLRHAFFRATSPFTFVHYVNIPPASQQRVRYWSAKRTAVVDKLPAVVLSLPDIHYVAQQDLQQNDYLWKIYWWGNHRDAALISVLRLETSLGGLTTARGWLHGRGFEKYTSSPFKHPNDKLGSSQQLQDDRFRRYGSIDELNDLESVPTFIRRFGEPALYRGWRILVRRGIIQAQGAKGQIEARLEEKPYSFTFAIDGINVDHAEDWERKTLIGIVWSSLARYYFFLTAGSWGTWHYKVHLNELLGLPVRFPQDRQLRAALVEVVDQLRNQPKPDYSLFSPRSYTTEQIAADTVRLEQQLDELIFDLYELNEAERDLVRDMCDYGLPFFYDPIKSVAARPVSRFQTYPQGTAHNLPGNRQAERSLEGYLYAFLQMWNRELEPKGEFRWRVIRRQRGSMLAVVFSTQEKGETLPDIPTDQQGDWDRILQQCSAALHTLVSRSIYIDGMVRAVSDTDIIIIKRDEQRLWTRSMAREDAEATLLQAINLQEAAQTQQ